MTGIVERAGVPKSSRNPASVMKLAWPFKVETLCGSADLGMQVATQTSPSFETVV